MNYWRPLYYAIFFVVIAYIASAIIDGTANDSAVSNRLLGLSGTATAGSRNLSDVHLYFSDKDNLFLTAEKRVITLLEDPAGFGVRIVEALINGPKENLVRTIPLGAKVRAFYITSEGTAYVDFNEAITERHPGGIWAEYLTICSIVNSLVLNVSEINAVKFLIEGNEALTLAGHIDLRFPFKADMLIVR